MPRKSENKKENGYMTKKDINKIGSNKIVVFESRKIRRVWHHDEWYFSVVDVVEALTDSPTPRQYWGKVKQREFIDLQLSPIWVQLKLESADGKKYATDCANTESMFRIIQSVSSPKAEPFKRWLARVGYERVQEIENPEIAQERMKELYEQKGYPKDWIDKRLRGIAIRQNLTDEWKERGIQGEQDYAILTAEISKATFGLTPSEYKDLKGLTRKNQNLRDHMDDLELIFTMLGERVTSEISHKEKPDTFDKSKTVAKRGGNVAGTARKETEKELGRSIVTNRNFLPESKKLIADKKHSK
jgi:prophage antirepressor-like protein